MKAKSCGKLADVQTWLDEEDRCDYDEAEGLFAISKAIRLYLGLLIEDRYY